MHKLVIVIPAYFEEEVLDSTISTLTQILEQLSEEKKISGGSTLLVVNDGSTDQTWSIIENYHKSNHFVSGINLSRNYGHQNALWAGMTAASVDADLLITIDADLQDDPKSIIEMVDKYHAGYDVVYGVRNNRESDTFFKRASANLFYKLMNKLGVNLIPNHADFRLIDRRVLKQLLQFPERNLFLRGMLPLVGFSSTKVFYKRRARQAGKSAACFRWLAFRVRRSSISVEPARPENRNILCIKCFCLLGMESLLLAKFRFDRLLFLVFCWSFCRPFTSCTV